MFAKSADLGNFPYVKNLAPENNSEHALGSFRLDLDVFDKSSADFSDLRIIDDTGTEIPFLIRAVTGSGAIITNRVVDFDQKQDNRKTIIEFKSRREPVRGIKIFTAEPNFSRQVLVEGQDSSGNYRTYMRGTCSFVKVGDVERDNRTLSLPTTARCSAWRLTIDNKDNPELQVTDITVITKEYEAVFINRHPGAYRLIYGGKGKPPRYDLSTIIRTSGSSHPAPYRLGEELENEDYAKASWGLRIGGKAILTIAILLMIGILIWGIATTSKQI